MIKPIDTSIIRNKLETGEKISAAWLQSAGSIPAEIIAGCGFDMAIVDMEHAPGDFLLVLQQLQAISAYPITPIVRIPELSPSVIKRALDAGAHGILIPHLQNSEELQRAIDYCLYPPEGCRGAAGSVRAAGFGMKPAESILDINRQILIIAMIETPSAIENLDQMLGIDRADGFFIGPFDIRCAMGVLHQPENAEFQNVLASIEHKIISAGKPLMSTASDMNDARKKYARGYSMLTLMSDTVSLAKTGMKIIDEFKNLPPE